MICDVSWPTCAPGLEISVVETVSGKRLSCHLQANMYKGKVSSFPFPMGVCVYVCVYVCMCVFVLVLVFVWF